MRTRRMRGGRRRSQRHLWASCRRIALWMRRWPVGRLHPHRKTIGTRQRANVLIQIWRKSPGSPTPCRVEQGLKALHVGRTTRPLRSLWPDNELPPLDDLGVDPAAAQAPLGHCLVGTRRRPSQAFPRAALPRACCPRKPGAGRLPRRGLALQALSPHAMAHGLRRCRNQSDPSDPDIWIWRASLLRLCHERRQVRPAHMPEPCLAPHPACPARLLPCARLANGPEGPLACPGTRACGAGLAAMSMPSIDLGWSAPPRPRPCDSKPALASPRRLAALPWERGHFWQPPSAHEACPAARARSCRAHAWSAKLSLERRGSDSLDRRRRPLSLLRLRRRLISRVNT